MKKERNGIEADWIRRKNRQRQQEEDCREEQEQKELPYDLQMMENHMDSIARQVL